MDVEILGEIKFGYITIPRFYTIIGNLNKMPGLKIYRAFNFQ